jgi:hypothetical protein
MEDASAQDRRLPVQKRVLGRETSDRRGSRGAAGGDRQAKSAVEEELRDAEGAVGKGERTWSMKIREAARQAGRRRAERQPRQSEAPRISFRTAGFAQRGRRADRALHRASLNATARAKRR